MTTTYKVLGQSLPAANTNTDVYTVPSGKSSVLSTISVCNQGLSTFFNIAIRPNGAALSNSQYIIYNSPIDQYDSVFLTIGATLSQNDNVTVYSVDSSNISYTLFGVEMV